MPTMADSNEFYLLTGNVGGVNSLLQLERAFQ